MASSIPHLSPFELQCLKRIWTRGEASVRDVVGDLREPPSYSTVRKIFERLEEKGAIQRLRMDRKAWVYRSTGSRVAMIRKEIRRFVDALFDGSAVSLVAHLADLEELTLEDLREVERQISRSRRATRGSVASRRGGTGS